jgi:hypothetical protein
MGLIGADEWLVPSPALRRDAYGNVTGSVVSKMIADIGAYGQYAGDAANTGTGIRTKRAAKRKYIWVKLKNVKGIFLKSGTQITPQMIVIKRAPRYAPRFRFYDVAKSYAARRINYHASRAVAQQIARYNR